MARTYSVRVLSRRLLESVQSDEWSGNCDVDVDECVSSPCEHNASCT
eukprot:COSAG06_NODE_69874_length_195_cov_31.687500_1_plen_46_part_10